MYLSGLLKGNSIYGMANLVDHPREVHVLTCDFFSSPELQAHQVSLQYTHDPASICLSIHNFIDLSLINGNHLLVSLSVCD